MPKYPLRALVLRKTKLGETDAIVSMLSEQGKNVRAVGKGMRKPGSKVGGRLEPYSLVDLLLYSGRSLDTIVEVESVETHGGIRLDYDRTTTASVVVDVLDKLTVEGAGEARLYGLGLATLGVIERASIETLELLLVGFLVKAMAMQGHRPVLGSCVASEAHALRGNTLRFSLAEGGVLCSECASASSSVISVGPNTCALISQVLGLTMERISALGETVDSNLTHEAFEVLKAFVKHHIPARMKALDYYERPVKDV